MGLMVIFNVTKTWKLPEYTPYFHHKIDYESVYEIFEEIFQDCYEEYVPVRTGNLRDSLVIRRKKHEIRVEVKCDYAEYVEFGTWCMEAQPYFSTALEIACMYAQLVAENIVWNAVQEEMDELATLHPDYYNEESDYYENIPLCVYDIVINNEDFRNYNPGGPAYIAPLMIDGFSFSPSGKETAQSWQASNPDMWRKGTTAHAVALERKKRKWKYVNSDGTATALSRKKIQESREAMMRFYEIKKAQMKQIGDIGHDIATKIGLSIGALSFASLASAGFNLILSFVVGLVVGIIVSFLAMNLCDGIMGTDEGIVLPEIIIT